MRAQNGACDSGEQYSTTAGVLGAEANHRTVCFCSLLIAQEVSLALAGRGRRSRILMCPEARVKGGAWGGPGEHRGLDHAMVVLTSREEMQTRLCELHCYCGMMCWLVHGFAEPLRSESRTPVRVMAGFSFKPTSSLRSSICPAFRGGHRATPGDSQELCDVTPKAQCLIQHASGFSTTAGPVAEALPSETLRVVSLLTGANTGSEEPHNGPLSCQ